MKWRNLVSTALAAVAVAAFSSNIPAIADLNKFEADTRGEFGIGSAAQYGSADLKLFPSRFLFCILMICLCSRELTAMFLVRFFYLCRKAVHVNENFR